MPPAPGPYIIIDLRYGTLKVSHFYCKGRGNSLFVRMPEQVLWMEETVEEHNARIIKHSQQVAKNNGGVYIFTHN